MYMNRKFVKATMHFLLVGLCYFPWDPPTREPGGVIAFESQYSVCLTSWMDTRSTPVDKGIDLETGERGRGGDRVLANVACFRSYPEN
jgi:hypothetical protein